MIDLFAGLRAQAYEAMKWFAAACMMTGTICMFNPTLAATSIWPWIAYVVGNGIWGVDAYLSKNIPWAVVSVLFVLLDALIFVERLIGAHWL